MEIVLFFRPKMPETMQKRVTEQKQIESVNVKRTVSHALLQN